MTTFVLILASLATDIMLGGLAYKAVKSQEKVISSLERIAESLDKRVTLLETRYDDSIRNSDWGSSHTHWNDGVPVSYQPSR